MGAHGHCRPQYEPIDLAEIAVAAAAQLRPLGNERGIVIELRTTGEAVTSGDGGLVKEAVHNMIENAIKHTPARSRVVVTSSGTPSPSLAYSCSAETGATAARRKNQAAAGSACLESIGKFCAGLGRTSR